MAAQRALKFACAATLSFAFIEFVGGRFAHSLALIADSAHLLSDAGALGLAFFAAWMAAQPATRKMSYGFHRVEILAALANGILLLTIAIFIVREAIFRLKSPAEIKTPLMLAVGAGGLLFNLFIAASLRRFVPGNLNVRSAFYHVAADFLGSFGVVFAGLVIWKTGWTLADPLVSVGIAFLIIGGGWQILRDVVTVLLEAAPARVDMERLESRLLSLKGVQEICDLHVWTISGGKEALSGHLAVLPGSDAKALLAQVTEILSHEFDISHSTIQIEEAGKKPHEPHDKPLAHGF